MKNWLIYEPPGGAEPTLEDAERFVVVREGFSKVAFFAPLIWLPWRRCWAGLAIYAAAEIAIGLLAVLLEIRGGPLVTLAVLPNLAVGLEAAWLRARSLEARGYTLAGSIFARGREEAEALFFHDWLSRRPEPRAAVGPSIAAPYQPANRGVLGLFPQPGAAR